MASLYFVNPSLQTYVEVANATAVTLTTKTLQTPPYTKEFQTVLQYPMAMATSADFGKAQAGELRVPALITSLELEATQSSGLANFMITPTLGDKADSAALTQAKRQDDEVWDYWSITVSTGASPLLLPVRDFPGYTNTAPVF